jgi:hypothetical protein
MGMPYAPVAGIVVLWLIIPAALDSAPRNISEVLEGPPRFARTYFESD